MSSAESEMMRLFDVVTKLTKERAELVEELEALKVELKEKNYAAGVALDLIWNQFFRSKYGEWDYPAQVARYCLEDLTIKGDRKMNIEMEKVKHIAVGIMKDKISIQKCVNEKFLRPGGIGSYWYAIHDSFQNVNLYFQRGNPAEEVNGITDESLLSIVIDRMEDTLKSEYATAEVKEARGHLLSALECLHSRTKTRIERGVEGTTTV